ncbi:MAG TPA: xanthine dehydrogenase family protein molybdopterin-binding subunit [Gaiellaceae bacterium]|jgi:carbon-monoxide dehydrogenase large subunit|nr:xanthine dehydrogenase family protein molybdopterin-binding subunit [Gaiellaceae bacterium]
MSILGNRVLRKEDGRFLRGEGEYVENLPLAGALSATFVRSLLPHARLLGVDTSAADGLPGIQVLTAADVDAGPFGPPPFPGLEQGMGRPLVARDTVRFVGDIVAIVVSEDRATGADAAELVVPDYEPLPAVVAPHDAAKDEVLLYPEVGTNVAGRSGSPEHDDDVFEGCDVVVEGTVVSQRMAPCPLEPRSAAAEIGEDGRLTAWLSTQTPHQDRMVLAMVLGLEPSQVRVVAPDVGGGFGAKMLCVEEILVAWLARRLGRPVRWTESRAESMVALGHGRAQQMDFRIGGTRDGKVLAYRLDVLQDAGAYPMLGAFLPNLTHLMASGVYAIPRIEFEGRSVVTNTTPTTAFRGAGRPEASQAIERAMDAFAAEIGMDPAEVRRRNFIERDAFPHQTASGATYDSGDYAGALDLALRAAGYDELRAEQRLRRDAGGSKQLGIGVSTYVEITNGIAETEFGEVEMQADGSAILRTGSFSHGQGHETTFAMIAGERLGLPVDRVSVVKGDTDVVASGTGTYGSKSTQIGGVAARLAADEVVEQAKRLVADYLEANVDDVVLDPGLGRFHVTGAPEPFLDWAGLAERAAADGKLEELKSTQEYQGMPTFPFGAHVAVVEVDVETGDVELQRLVAVDDAGTLVNPLVAEGQVHGGVATGVAQALFEHAVYDDDGNPMTDTFTSYAFPAASDLPLWEAVEMETPTPANALGAKGIGESGTIGSTPAVHNAVIDALAPYGVRYVEMPCRGETVWRSLLEAQA